MFGLGAEMPLSLSDKDKQQTLKSLGISVARSKFQGVNEKMGPEQYHKYMQYVFDTQFKTPEEKKEIVFKGFAEGRSR